MMSASPLRALRALATSAALIAMVGVASFVLGAPEVAERAEPVTGSAAVVLEINGPIGPATSRYVVRGLESAHRSGSRLVILEIDTPGGLDSAMRDIIRAILASPIPVVSYVFPPGARAASAGTYILYASHVAAMAPATNLGAATPVSIGGEPEPAPSPAPLPEKPPVKHPGGAPGGDGAPASPAATTAMERKVVNDAVAYIRGLAELRGRNAEWAEQAVRGAASLPASAALQQKVVDVVARDLPDLLAQIDGREVRIDSLTGKLATRDLTVARITPECRPTPYAS